MPYVYDAVLYWESCTGESLYVSAVKQGRISRVYDDGDAPDDTKHSIKGANS